MFNFVLLLRHQSKIFVNYVRPTCTNPNWQAVSDQTSGTDRYCVVKRGWSPIQWLFCGWVWMSLIHNERCDLSTRHFTPTMFINHSLPLSGLLLSHKRAFFLFFWVPFIHFSYSSSVPFGCFLHALSMKCFDAIGSDWLTQCNTSTVKSSRNSEVLWGILSSALGGTEGPSRAFFRHGSFYFFPSPSLPPSLHARSKVVGRGEAGVGNLAGIIGFFFLFLWFLWLYWDGS